MGWNTIHDNLILSAKVKYLFQEKFGLCGLSSTRINGLSVVDKVFFENVSATKKKFHCSTRYPYKCKLGHFVKFFLTVGSFVYFVKYKGRIYLHWIYLITVMFFPWRNEPKQLDPYRSKSSTWFSRNRR